MKQKKIFVVFVNASIFSALVIITEAIMGTWFKPYENLVYSPSANFNKEFRYKSKNYKGENVDYIFKTDIDGYRSYERSKTKQLVLTIGGSTTHQRLVGEGYTWQDVLDKKLLYKLDFINGGLDGHSSYGHLYALSSWYSKSLPKNKVAKVIYYFGNNDSYLLSKGHKDLLLSIDRVGARSFSKNYLRIIGINAKDFLWRNSFFYKEIRLLVDKAKYLKTPKKIVHYGHGNKHDFLDKGKLFQIPPHGSNSAYINLIVKMVKTTQSFFPKAEVYFIQQGNPGCRFLSPYLVLDRHQFDNGSMGKESDFCKKLGQVYLAQDKAVAILEKENQPKVIKMYLENIISEDGVYDAVHTNDKGSRQIGEYIYKEIFQN